MKRETTFADAMIVFTLAVIMFVGLISWHWARASNQAAWNREGIEITALEVFLGAKPAQHLIEIKQ